MDHLSDEVSLVIYSFLDVKDLLAMRKVSVRHARLTMDKKMWKWVRICDMELVRDEEYFTGKGSSQTLLMNLKDLDCTSCIDLHDDLPWLFCRIQEVYWPYS